MSEYGRTVAIVLAAGSGKRMGGKVPKQFLPLYEKPALFWTLKAFEESLCDAVVLVVSSDEAKEYCQEELLDKTGFNKIKAIVLGGAERYDSVWKGLQSISYEVSGGTDYVLIHDGARCLVTPEIIHRTLSDAREYGSGIASVPVKDTIKRVDERGFAEETIDRSVLRQMQTPQTFRFREIYEAYQFLMKCDPIPRVTDDAEVFAISSDQRAYLSEGSYENLKLTTPEDLILAEAILRKRLT